MSEPAERRAAPKPAGSPWGLSPDTHSPVDCVCLAKGRASWPDAACKADGVPAVEGLSANCYTFSMFIARKQTKGSHDRGAWPWRCQTVLV